MAMSARIHKKSNTLKIVVDGHEIHDVASYAISETVDAPTRLTLEIILLNDLEVQIE